MPLAVVCILACCAVLALAARASGLVYVGRTLAGRTIVRNVTLSGQRMRVLDVAGTYQSATYLDERWCDPVFAYHHLFDHMFDAWAEGDGPASVACLGGGGYAIPRHLVAHRPQVREIAVIELDPAIVRIAWRHFFLRRLERTFGAIESGRLQLHTGDAYTWLLHTQQSFDVIVNDCFLGLEPERALMSDEAARLVCDRLNDQGLYLINVVAALTGPKSTVLVQQMDALATQFSNLWIYPCGADDPTVPDNNVVIATNNKHVFAGALKWNARNHEGGADGDTWAWPASNENQTPDS